jgi:hypothetical protein
VTKSEAGPASSAWRICKIIAINPKVRWEVKAAVPVQEPSPRATRRVESRTIQHKFRRTSWQSSFQYSTGADLDDRFRLTVDCMKMRWIVVSIVNIDGDAVKFGNGWHS